MEIWQTILLGVLGLGFMGDIILHFTLPHRKRIDNADAEMKEHDADEAEVKRLHLQIGHQQETLDIYLKLEKDNAERISALNKALNEKTEQIRNLTAQLIDSEHGRNADKDEIARLTSDNANLRVLVEHYKMWHCRKNDCCDRIPPNEKLKGLKYEIPRKQK